MNKPYYELLPESEWKYCKTHKRNATHRLHANGWTSVVCNPDLAGILACCDTGTFKHVYDSK